MEEGTYVKHRLIMEMFLSIGHEELGGVDFDCST